MVCILGRTSATTALLILSTRHSLFLSSSALSSLVVSSSSYSFSTFTAKATTAPATSTAAAAAKFKTYLPLTATARNLSSRHATDINIMTDLDTGYLNAQDAAALDAELMATPGFSLEQLMELAGLAVAEAVYDVVVGDERDAKVGGKGDEKNKKHVLLVCG